VGVFVALGGPETWWDRIYTHVHSERGAALLAVDGAGGERQKTTLLYGSAVLPIFDPVKGRVVGVPNNLGQEPLFGASGFGNPFVSIVPDMAVFDGRLYLAALDDSGAGPDLFGALVAQEGLLDLPDDVVAVLDPMVQAAFDAYAGADLYRMDTPYLPLAAEDLTGAGNRYNTAFKVLLPLGDRLLAGTHDPFNLRTDETEPGGYELLSFSPRAD
jgi:hypothetical protein